LCIDDKLLVYLSEQCRR